MRVPKLHLRCKPILAGKIGDGLVMRCRCGGIRFEGTWMERRWFLYEPWNADKRPLEFLVT